MRAILGLAAVEQAVVVGVGIGRIGPEEELEGVGEAVGVGVRLAVEGRISPHATPSASARSTMCARCPPESSSAAIVVVRGRMPVAKSSRLSIISSIDATRWTP